ncbi:GNAT family N-acetyltransferase [Longispora albida]|uniref:GNAT family N-acetyltransferase n=1 Tax=Longispora albida TaxID=203523 RepID=UPI00036FABA9|nr:GNAT family protein [Longispora albida]
MLSPEYPIVTPRLLLRPFAPADVAGVHAFESLPEVHRYLYSEPRDLAAVEELVARRAAGTALREPDDYLSLVVELKETGAVIGHVLLHWVSAEHRQGEVGYVFSPAYAGQGYATEAAEPMLRLGFDGLGLHRIVGRLDGRNTPSARLLERLGMRREAHLVQNEFVKGEWTDEVVYAMLASEWAAR